MLCAVFLLRVQYILLFSQQTETETGQAAALLAAAAAQSDRAALSTLGEKADFDGLLLLTPNAQDGFAVAPCRGNGNAFAADLAREALYTGTQVQSTDIQFGFCIRARVETACYQPMTDENGKPAVLYGYRLRSCPLMSRTPEHTLSFCIIFAVAAGFLLLYNRRIFHIVVRPLERMKAKACALTEGNEDFEPLAQTGDEIKLIGNAFELLHDRQQRLDESLDYAKEIQSRILGRQQDFNETFRDCGVYYKPLALVSGDFYWIEQFERGTVLVMGDCTGHGIPGALMTMMVISILESIVTEQNCQDTKNILFKLDRQLSSILNTHASKREGETYIKHGLDLIVLFIDRQHKTIKLSAASTNLYIVKPLNSVEVVRGQRLFIGDGKLKDKNQVKSVYLKYAPKCCYYMATDGLFEQIGGYKHIPYGYTRFKSILFEHSAVGTQAAINAVMQDFGTYMHGELQRDDITVIGFRL